MAKPPVPPKPAPEAREKAETLKRAWEKRIHAGEEAQKEWWEDGRGNKKFVRGSCWNDVMDQQLPNSQWSKTTANRMHALVNGYLATTVYRRPNVNAKPTKPGDDAMKRSIVDASWLNYCMRECRAEEHLHLATYDAIIYGAGFIEQGLDSKRGGTAYMNWASAEDIVCDPGSNTVMESCGWIARRITMNVRTARKLYNVPDLKADGESQHKPHSTGNASQHVGGGVDDERITLWRIWARGDEPEEDEVVEEEEDRVPVEADGMGQEREGADVREGADNGRDVAGDPNQSELEAYLSKHGNRRFILAMNHPVLLEDVPWPFICDEFPITIIRVHRVPGELLPYSPLRPVKELQKQINWALTFLITQMRRTSQIKYVANKSAFPSMSVEQIESMLTLDSEQVIIAQDALDRALVPIKFDGLSQPPLQMLELMQEQFDTISGFAEMFGGVENSRSASEAVIKQERAETLTDLMRQATEAAVNEILRHMLQMSWSATPVETVAKAVGPDLVKMGVDRITGQPIPVGVYWDTEMSPEAIRAETDVVLEPGSMRRVNRDQEMQDIFMMLDKSLGIGAQFPAMGMQPNPEAWLKFINSMLRRGYEAMGWVDGVQFLIPPEAVGLLPPEQGNQTMNIDQSTHLTEGDASYTAPSPTFHAPNPSLSLSYKQGDSKPQAATTGAA